MSATSRLFARMMLLCLAGLLVAGCASDDAGEDSGSNATSQVRVISLGENSSSTLGQDAAAYLGYLEKEGLEVETTYGQDAVSALASGDADYAVTSPNRIIGAVEKGLEATIIGPTVTSFVQYVIVKSDSSIASLDDFKGGEIGISQFGSAGHYSTLKVAEALHWKNSDYTVVPLGGLDSLTAALASGTVDAFMWSAEAAFAIEAKGEGAIIGNVADIIPPTPLNVLVVADKYLDENPSQVRAFCDAFYGAQKEFKDDPEVVTKAYTSWGYDAAVIEKVIDNAMPFLADSGLISDEQLANIADATNSTIEGADVDEQDVADHYRNCSDMS